MLDFIRQHDTIIAPFIGIVLPTFGFLIAWAISKKQEARERRRERRLDEVRRYLNTRGPLP